MWWCTLHTTRIPKYKSYLNIIICSESNVQDPILERKKNVEQCSVINFDNTKSFVCIFSAFGHLYISFHFTYRKIKIMLINKINVGSGSSTVANSCFFRLSLLDRRPMREELQLQNKMSDPVQHLDVTLRKTLRPPL